MKDVGGVEFPESFKKMVDDPKKPAEDSNVATVTKKTDGKPKE
jgi:hypothetical protein